MKDFFGRLGLTAIITLSIFVGYPLSAGQKLVGSQKDLAWAKQLEKYPLTKGAKRLHLDLSIPSEETEDDGIYLNRSSNFCITDDLLICVANTGEHCIDEYDLNGRLVHRFGTKGQGPNDFLTPRSIDIDGAGRLWIEDKGNGRVKIVNKAGTVINTFKYFISANLIKVNKSSNQAYVHIRDVDPKGPLFNVMNERGEILRSFGHKKNFANSTPFHDTVCFSINRGGSHVVVAWKFFDTCRIYRDDGSLESEFRVVHEAINDQTRLNLQSSTVDSSITFRSLIEAVFAGENSIYLLTCSPRMEILELNYSGAIRGVYRYDTQFEYVANDLYVIEEGKQKRFVVLQNLPEYRIDIFSIKTENRNEGAEH